ncbi:unnamed protein product [Larinioides sclopetarius]|uniref:Receptor ligand binding region domain-containing protein n=1 Tax=Larinioides sclopetarius TaxID=280406 RepID=A0AAV1Z7K9_9ARAC
MKLMDKVRFSSKLNLLIIIEVLILIFGWNKNTHCVKMKSEINVNQIEDKEFLYPNMLLRFENKTNGNRHKKTRMPAVSDILFSSFKKRKLTAFNFSWPVKRVAEIDGDIILGGLMMIHEREDQRICGPIMPQGGIQALECMLYTMDWVNDQRDFLPGIKLGAYVLDDCDKDTYGLEQAVDFIKELAQKTITSTSSQENYRLLRETGHLGVQPGRGCKLICSGVSEDEELRYC